jgi:two-component system sensor histidine kinase RegB
MGDAHVINFRWLLRLRWWAIVGQIITILTVEWVLQIPLPLMALFALVAVGAASNAACGRWVRSAPAVQEWMLGALMALDVLLLTGLLSLTGGSFNPFSSLYLVHIVLAAVVLQPRISWMLVTLSLACFGALFVIPVGSPIGGADAQAHAEHVRMHLEGMWVAFGVTAGFIVYFVQRVRRALAQREAELVAARNLTTRNEKFASLATLAAGAAHELSTPLSTIAVVANELERQLAGSNGSSGAAADVRLIREQVSRCRDILMQMAADAGQGTGEAIASVAIEDLIAQAIEGVPDPAQLTVVVEPPARGRALHVPVRAVAQALRGVLKNAQQASPGHAAVELRVGVDAAAWRFTVRDAGAGMGDDVLAHVGEPFFTTKPPGQGMGLGLFLTRAVLTRLGGTLELTSAKGKGTTAVLTLPAGDAATIYRIAPPGAARRP